MLAAAAPAHVVWARTPPTLMHDRRLAVCVGHGLGRRLVQVRAQGQHDVIPGDVPAPGVQILPANPSRRRLRCVITNSHEQNLPASALREPQRMTKWAGDATKFTYPSRTTFRTRAATLQAGPEAAGQPQARHVHHARCLHHGGQAGRLGEYYNRPQTCNRTIQLRIRSMHYQRRIT